MGGKKHYIDTALCSLYELPPSLYLCSVLSSAYEATEILHFSQGHLVPDQVFFLNTHREVYLWIGI